MYRRALYSFTVLCALSAVATAQTAKPATVGNVMRGKYLVNNVGMCGDCHTPADKKGNLIKSKMLQGTPLMFKPTVPVPGWIPVAPAIAGLIWSDDQAITFFTTGKRPDGSMAGPPMPQFRFNKTDAADITAYLKSLKP
jgi:mono/diheme cytochrome c family protein